MDEDDKNVDDLGDALSNLFGPFTNKTDSKTGTKPKVLKDSKPNIKFGQRPKELQPANSLLSNRPNSKTRSNIIPIFPRSNESLDKTSSFANRNSKFSIRTGRRPKEQTTYRYEESNTPNLGQNDESAIKKSTGQDRKFGKYGKSFEANRTFPRNDNRGAAQRLPYPHKNKKENLFDARRLRSKSHLDLEQILQLESEIPEQIILSLIKKIDQFKRVIGGSLSFEDVVLLLRVFERICSSHFDENRGKLITSIVNAKFHEKILEYILLLPTQSIVEKTRSRFFWEDQERFWKNSLIFYENIFEFMPSTACEILPKIVKATILSINDIESDIKLSSNIKEQLQKFHEKLKTAIEKQSKRNVHLQEPPDNFRELNIYPTAEEITTDSVPFIRPIVINSAYQSVEHYLDVQFRLLKEDFTASLRNGICSILKNDTKKSEQQYDVRIYENVQFISPHIIHDRVASLLQYTKEINKRSIEESAKRFIYGSLLCFTSDNFENISFGTVAESEIQYLRRGQIVVDVQKGKINFNNKYTMVECTVFFQPYYQVLTALQKIQEDIFPFKDYIIDVTSKTKPPKYITSSTEAYFMKNKYKFKILSEETWPKAEDVGLNDSQMKAFHSALTQEFCIIQGPPGTGKTYTTLRIVEFMLRNKLELKYDGPILVICYTNHALDQFLEGVMPFTDYIVRIGGQSKSEKMQQYALKNYRDMIKKRIFRAKSKLFDEYDELITIKDDYDDDIYFNPDEHKYNFSDYMKYDTKNNAASEYFDNMKTLEKYERLLNAILAMNGVLSFYFFKQYNIIDAEHPFFTISNERLISWLLENNETIKGYNNHNQVEPIDIQDIATNIQRELYGERNVTDYSFEEEIGFTEISSSKMYLMRPSDFQEQINVYEAQSAEVMIKTKNPDTQKKFQAHYQKRIDSLTQKRDYLSWRLQQCKTETKITPPNMNTPPNLLNPDERWNLYRYWLQILRITIYDAIAEMDDEFRKSYKLYQEINQLKDIYILNKMKVIGMTTTGAAKHHKLLQILQCPIVIAEEAAEVLESHIVVSLTKHCQHLILIGDHQQLRPNTAQYNLAIKYNLEISLFERMVKNGIHCQRLNIQHRMRPEFAKLIVPAIYPTLDNSSSVQNLPPVKGAAHNLFFINHSTFENYIHDSSSHRNIFEAKYILQLAKYFIKQGYSPEEITILTTYKGQMYLMSDERKKMFDADLNNVRITVVDNFQGEENKIILLSLVRSNKEGIIGFLKTENRVCVALSRAKEGFYIIGNMSNLEQSSKIWPKIKTVLEDQNAIGDLTLACQVHSTGTTITKLEDFDKMPEGGCNVPCNTTMNCGHICKLMCHPYDREHEIYKCEENCKKTCPRNHLCKQLCYIKPCPPCEIKIKTVLTCGHTQAVPCYMKIEEYKCKAKVNSELPCSHVMEKFCHEDPEKVSCTYPCQKVLDCEHVVNYECHNREFISKSTDKCIEPCKRILKGCSTNKHICTLLCHEICPPCTILVPKRRDTCTHKVKVPCNENIVDKICRDKCRKILACGHHCPKLCYEECGNCTVMVTKTIKECGHSIKTPCKNEVDIKMCQEKCVKILNCGHSCKNKCNETCTTGCQEYVTFKNDSGNMVTDFCHLQPKISCDDVTE